MGASMIRRGSLEEEEQKAKLFTEESKGSGNPLAAGLLAACRAEVCEPREA